MCGPDKPAESSWPSQARPYRTARYQIRICFLAALGTTLPNRSAPQTRPSLPAQLLAAVCFSNRAQMNTGPSVRSMLPVCTSLSFTPSGARSRWYHAHSALTDGPHGTHC
uniref:Uncharacterized protein n=1 Tax=Knipowitschia caucasica TaxID=637954 RepID=A0AAV2LCH0_KNICA